MHFRTPLLCASLLGVVTAFGQAPATTAPRFSADPAIEANVTALLARMTLEEKVGQLAQFSSQQFATGPAAPADVLAEIKAGRVGSMLNVVGADYVRRMQTVALKETRLGIPLLFGYDVIHGYRTIFPIPLAQSASWDLEAMEQAERVAAIEASAAGVHWTFAPMMDIARDPRWGRIAEGSGEDTFLGSQIAAARVRGFQGDLSRPDMILACAKHFAAYGAVQAGRDYHTTDVPVRTLREVYLPPFKAAVDAGVATVMAAFNDIDGVPASGNPFLFDQVLRKEWGFDGFVVSDWTSIRELINHSFAEDDREAGLKAFTAGVDMDMESRIFYPQLVQLVKEGRVSEEQVERSAGRILAAKHALGLFEDPYRATTVEREKANTMRPEFLDAAQALARSSFVLLKNKGGALPLKADARVAVIGPFARATQDLLGSWPGQGRKEQVDTIETELQRVLGKDRLSFVAGADPKSDDRSGFEAARRAAEKADVVLAILGETQEMSGEGNNRTQLGLPGGQQALLEELAKTKKPVVLLLVTGRPLVLTEVLPLVDSLLVVWQPGTRGAAAITEVVTGKYSPSGKLTATFPRSVGQIPIFYNAKPTGRPQPEGKREQYKTNYLDSPNEPLFPFGYGLSYTTFRYDGLRLSGRELRADGTLSVTVTLTNTGERDGIEIAQLYVRDLAGSVTRPVRELKGFQRVALKTGESRELTFTLKPEDLAFWRADMTFGPEAGAFEVYVGGDSDTRLKERFTLSL